MGTKTAKKLADIWKRDANKVQVPVIASTDKVKEPEMKRSDKSFAASITAERKVIPEAVELGKEIFAKDDISVTATKKGAAGMDSVVKGMEVKAAAPNLEMTDEDLDMSDFEDELSAGEGFEFEDTEYGSDPLPAEKDIFDVEEDSLPEIVDDVNELASEISDEAMELDTMIDDLDEMSEEIEEEEMVEENLEIPVEEDITEIPKEVVTGKIITLKVSAEQLKDYAPDEAVIVDIDGTDTPGTVSEINETDNTISVELADTDGGISGVDVELPEETETPIVKAEKKVKAENDKYIASLEDFSKEINLNNSDINDFLLGDVYSDVEYDKKGYTAKLYEDYKTMVDDGSLDLYDGERTTLDAWENYFNTSLTESNYYWDIIKSYKIVKAAQALRGFSEACYDQNSITELEEALSSDADETDMKVWSLTEAEWRDSIKEALAAKKSDAGSTTAKKKVKSENDSSVRFIAYDPTTKEVIKTFLYYSDEVEMFRKSNPNLRLISDHPRYKHILEGLSNYEEVSTTVRSSRKIKAEDYKDKSDEDIAEEFDGMTVGTITVGKDDKGTVSGTIYLNISGKDADESERLDGWIFHNYAEWKKDNSVEPHVALDNWYPNKAYSTIENAIVDKLKNKKEAKKKVKSKSQKVEAYDYPIEEYKMNIAGKKPLSYSIDSDGDLVFVLDMTFSSDSFQGKVDQAIEAGYEEFLHSELGTDNGITDSNKEEILWGSDVQDHLVGSTTAKKKVKAMSEEDKAEYLKIAATKKREPRRSARSILGK